MRIIERIKNLFRRKEARSVEELTNITDHPKIAVTHDEYERIRQNLIYFESKWDDIDYLNSNGQTRTRKKYHLPIAKTVSKKIASLVFNEQAEIKLDDETANEFINDILSSDKFNKNFERYLESCLALGGMAMRPYFDGKTIKIAFIQAPVFLPLQNNTQDISSAVIITKSRKVDDKKNIYFTLMEFHEWDKDQYIISNELYKSTHLERVGTRVHLSELYDDLEESVTITNLSRPLFTYLKTPGMNNKDIDSPLGLSIYDNAKTTIDFINRTYDEFAWEIKMGQRRVMVPEMTTRIAFNKQGEREVSRRVFDPNENIFVSYGNPDIDKTIAVTDLTTDIRSESYIQAINHGLSLFEMQIGVSSGMFTFDGKSMKTATEVVSENSDTYQMRNSIVSMVEQALKELIISICELGLSYGIYHGVIPTFDSISVNLDDGVFTDRDKELEYWTKALAAGLISKQYAIQKTLNITEEESLKMLQQINQNMIDDTTNARDDFDRQLYGD